MAEHSLCSLCGVNSALRFAFRLTACLFSMCCVCFWDCACDGNDGEKWGYRKRHFRSHSHYHYLTTTTSSSSSTTITTKMLFIRPPHSHSTSCAVSFLFLTFNENFNSTRDKLTCREKERMEQSDERNRKDRRIHYTHTSTGTDTHNDRLIDNFCWLFCAMIILHMIIHDMVFVLVCDQKYPLDV